MKFLKKLLFGALLGGTAYLIFSKRGKEIREEIKKSLPELLLMVREQVKNKKQNIDEAINDVVKKYAQTKRLMIDTVKPMKKELKKELKNFKKN